MLLVLLVFNEATTEKTEENHYKLLVLLVFNGYVPILVGYGVFTLSFACF